MENAFRNILHNLIISLQIMQCACACNLENFEWFVRIMQAPTNPDYCILSAFIHNVLYFFSLHSTFVQFNFIIITILLEFFFHWYGIPFSALNMFRNKKKNLHPAPVRLREKTWYNMCQWRDADKFYALPTECPFYQSFSIPKPHSTYQFYRNLYEKINWALPVQSMRAYVHFFVFIYHVTCLLSIKRRCTEARCWQLRWLWNTINNTCLLILMI